MKFSEKAFKLISKEWVGASHEVEWVGAFQAESNDPRS